MIRKNPNGDMPVISPSAYVDKTAIICGKVFIEGDVFVGPYAVIRADEVNEEGDMDPIIIGANSNIQDGVVIHSKAGALVKIGERSSIAHRSIVHGPCVIGDDVFVGFNSVLFNTTVGNGSVIRHNSVIEGCEVPENYHIPSTTTIHSNEDLKHIKQVTPVQATFSESVVQANTELVKGYKRLNNEF